MNIFLKLAKNKYAWIVSGAIVLILLYVFVFKDSSNNLETIDVKLQTFEQQVSVAGKVIPAENVDLGFESTGKVSAVYKDVGDRVLAGQILVVLSSGDVSADVLKAEADLANSLLQAIKSKLRILKSVKKS